MPNHSAARDRVDPLRRDRLRLGFTTAVAGLALTLTACGATTAVSPPDQERALGETIAPAPEAWADFRLPRDFSAVMVSTDDSVASHHLSAAVTAWADTADVDLEVVPATNPSRYVDAIHQAIDHDSDLVISASEGLADAMALVTASWLDQQFLVLGAELAEPTENVTAAVWPGATYRGGVGAPHSPEPEPVTVETATRAVEAAVAALMQGDAGQVISVE